METNIPGIYAAGDICTYEGKVKLIACGFGEAPTAVNNAKAYFDPNAKLQPMHSSSMFIEIKAPSIRGRSFYFIYHSTLNSINYRTQCAFRLKNYCFLLLPNTNNTPPTKNEIPAPTDIIHGDAAPVFGNSLSVLLAAL